MGVFFSDVPISVMPLFQMFDIMKRHSANLISNMQKKADKDQPLEMKE